MRQGADPGALDPNIMNANPNVNNEINVPVLNNFSVYTNKKLMVATFSIQNVRSLNISTRNEITDKKLLAICRAKFLQGVPPHFMAQALSV